ncbi:carbon-nitrogen family hydrolase [Bacillus sp. 7884-1]|uniref:carbon-nitrogen family hydrolase n=1 Tax=Bacillus sp. 7884-1 TaxID=2021693 RepID=UPI000BA65E36|nr:carbon-nitrogen family hydrolase [Bacillus sp. 7884-1]PAE43180.1 carbon-nitrogen hydrolase [Bacillus sp. 7884-1]TDL72750.1 carbon-nitrogen family hydrolase [Rhodococcus qingshengii]
MKLKITCLQMDIAFGNPSENYQNAERLIEEAMKENPDIIVFPELWTTGYDLTRLDTIADKGAVNTIDFLKKAAKKYQVHFVGGSVANQGEQGVKNTLLIINNKGHLVHSYSKLHLFKLMDEHLYLEAGEEKGLFELDNRLFGGVICYDIRFPEWIRAHTSKGAEALFVVAEWPAPRLSHWRSLLIARAIENQCFVIACNRSGHDPNNEFAGHSMIIDPWGDVIAEAGATEEILSAIIELDLVKDIRKQIPIFEDRRPDLY